MPNAGLKSGFGLLLYHLSYRSGLRAGIEPATHGGMIEIKDFGIAREDGRVLMRCDGAVS